MKHSLDELIEIANRYYPRGMAVDDRYRETEESRRLVGVRRRVGADVAPWHAMLRRIGHQLAEHVVRDRSSGIYTGDFDAAYSGEACLPRAEGEHDHTVSFLVSILAPYYVVYSTRIVGGPHEMHVRDASTSFVCTIDVDTCFILPAGVAASDADAMRGLRQVIRFDFSSEEAPLARCIAREIEATFGFERMPPEVGNVIVPEVSTSLRALGEATLYDCLFADNW